MTDLIGRLGAGAKSMDTIPKSLDKAMDKANPSSNHVDPGISVRYGPVEKVDGDDRIKVDAKTNGNVNGKRKSRQSMSNGKSYRDASSDEEDIPVVCLK